MIVNLLIVNTNVPRVRSDSVCILNKSDKQTLHINHTHSQDGGSGNLVPILCSIIGADEIKTLIKVVNNSMYLKFLLIITVSTL